MSLKDKYHKFLEWQRIVAPAESNLSIGTTIRMSLTILLPAVVIIAAGGISNIVKNRIL